MPKRKITKSRCHFKKSFLWELCGSDKNIFRCDRVPHQSYYKIAYVPNRIHCWQWIQVQQWIDNGLWTNALLAVDSFLAVGSKCEGKTNPLLAVHSSAAVDWKWPLNECTAGSGFIPSSGFNIYVCPFPNVELTANSCLAVDCLSSSTFKKYPNVEPITHCSLLASHSQQN